MIYNSARVKQLQTVLQELSEEICFAHISFTRKVKTMYQTGFDGFYSGLHDAGVTRRLFGEKFAEMASLLSQAEEVSERTSGSGRLNWKAQIDSLQDSSVRLRDEVFRIIVMGDMKRGKSTLLNALLGEDVLPRNVTASTALLTTIRYGAGKEVVVNFTNGRQLPLSFEDFRRQYTISPDEAKHLEDEGKYAFPDVDYAGVTFPLSILESGVEVIDTPGLNDTVAREEKVTDFLRHCHAVLFLFSAVQPFTLDERRFLERCIKDRGYTVFFLINHWDEIRNKLTNPDDPAGLHREEDRIRTVFRTNLTPYCMVDGRDLYSIRIFEVSALNALRQRLNNGAPDPSFSEFLGTLTDFLTNERAAAELRQAVVSARGVFTRVHESINRRIPLLGDDVAKLEERIRQAQPEFHKLEELRNAFLHEVHIAGLEQADRLAESNSQFIRGLGATFQEDFAPYLPELKLREFFRKKNREKFITEVEVAFKKYLEAKMSQWSLEAKKLQHVVFSNLAEKAQSYGHSYQSAVERLTALEISGGGVSLPSTAGQDQSPVWTRAGAAILSLLSGDLAGAAMGTTGAFNWKNILTNLGGVIAVSALLTVIFHATLGPLGIILTGLVIGGVQAERARRKLIEGLQKELVKLLPDIALKSSNDVRERVRQGFSSFEEEIIVPITADIEAMRAELDNLLAKKRKGQIDSAEEVRRLTEVNTALLTLCDELAESYDSYLV